MTRVVRQGAPVRQQPASAAAPANRPKRPRPGEKIEKPRIAKPGGTTGEDVEQAHQADVTGESTGPVDAAALHEAAHAAGWLENDRQVDEKQDARDEALESEERKEGDPQKGPQAANKGATAANKPGQGGLTQKPRDGFFGLGLNNPKGGAPQQTEKARAAVPVTAKDPVTALKTAQALGNEQALKHPKQPDAFTVLHSAQPPGVFFKEDGFTEGHTEDQDDPELAAAVEEAIRLLFGVKGVLRVGPGRNEAEEPVVVVVATQGFTETAMRTVPEKVHRFATLVAVPYDCLPLKKERF